MTTATFYRDAHGITGFEVTGHTDYSEAGSDIVCSAVSAVAQTTVIGLKETVYLEVLVQMDEGRLACRLPAASAVSVLSPTWRLIQLKISSMPNITPPHLSSDTRR
ncbi:MAG: ribosomal-processing cysteine protease Prp [Ammonifex sp.]|nr:MAG: ribosomal-processing cysteine protease Prp [Ammonifex sp.]